MRLRLDRKQMRQDEAIKRQEQYSALPATHKLVRLDKTLGKNTGATRQRARLTKQIEAEKKSA